MTCRLCLTNKGPLCDSCYQVLRWTPAARLIEAGRKAVQEWFRSNPTE